MVAIFPSGTVSLSLRAWAVAPQRKLQRGAWAVSESRQTFCPRRGPFSVSNVVSFGQELMFYTQNNLGPEQGNCLWGLGAFGDLEVATGRPLD